MRRPDRRLALRRHARGRRGVAADPGRSRRRGRPTRTVIGFRAAAPREPGRPGPGGAGRRPVARLRRPSTSGACGPATSARPSTPIRGHGTRSASVAPPIPGATRRSASDKREGWEVAEADHDPFPADVGNERAAEEQSAGTPNPTGGTDDAHGRRRTTGEPADATLSPGPQRIGLAAARADDERTNHRLRADMRRYRRATTRSTWSSSGCGAGGATLLQRLARAGWRRWSGWTPARSGIPTPTGSATRPAPTACTGPSPGSSPAPIRCRWDRTTQVGEWAGPWSTTPATPPASTPRTSAPTASDGVGADWPISYEDLRPYYEAIEEELPVSGQSWPWGDPHRYPYSPQPLGGNGEVFVRGAHALGIPTTGRAGSHRQRPVREPAPLYLPGVLPPGLQGKRQGVPAHHPYSRRPRPRGGDPGQLHGYPGRRRRSRSGDRRHLLDWWRRALPGGPAGGGGRLFHRDTPPAAAFGQQAVPGRAVQRPWPGRALRDGAGRPSDWPAASTTRSACTRRHHRR